MKETPIDVSKVPILLIPMMDEEEVFTNGTTNWITRKVSPKEMSTVGPYLVGIKVRAKLSGKSTNFQYRVVGEWSYDKASWTSFSSTLLGTQTADGAANGSEYTTATDFGMYIRVRVEVSNSSGTAIESGTLSVTLLLHWIS